MHSLRIPLTCSFQLEVSRDEDRLVRRQEGTGLREDSEGDVGQRGTEGEERPPHGLHDGKGLCWDTYSAARAECQGLEERFRLC
jgi:hypothetical protein